MRPNGLCRLSFAFTVAIAAAGLHASPQEPATPREPAAGAPPRGSSAAKQARPSPQSARPVAAPTLDVTVVDTAGRPIQGAVVSALPSVGGYNGMQLRVEKLRSGISNQDGHARLERIPVGPWVVTVRARGFQVARETRLTSTAFTVKLNKGGTITGIVRDGTTKAPVPGARVALEDAMPMPSDWQEGVARNEAVADARGAFRLEGVGRGRVSVVARARGYGMGTRNDARAGARLELFLFPGPTLFGTVRDSAGRPVAGASVRLFAQGWSSPPPVDATDADGRFTVAGIQPGEYWIIVRSGGRAPGLRAVVLTERDGAADIVLGEGGFLTGRTVDDSGRPIAGATVGPEALGGRGLPQLVADSLAARSRADGTFVLGPLPAGAFSILLSHAGHAAAHTQATVTSLQSVDLHDVVLESALAVRGQVRDREGTAIAGALVRVQPRAGGGEATAEAETESDGGFVVGGLSAGAYSVTADAAGYAYGHATATAGGEAVSIVLDAGAIIVGRVVDATGQPVDRATVTGETTDGPQREHAFVSATTEEEAAGLFTIRDAAPGIYALKIVAAGAGRGSLTGVKAVAGRTTDVGTVALGATGTVKGMVVDNDGQGVPGAAIQVRPDAHASYSDDPSGQTELTGAFEVAGVRPGRVDVYVSHPSYVSSRLTAVEVDPEKELAPLRIVLTRGGRIEGQAYRRDGRPFEDGRVMVWSNAGSAGDSGEPVPTQADGSFAIDHVPLGRVTVSLTTRVASYPQISGPPGMTVLVGVASRELDIREGETAAVDFVTREVVVAGHVTRSGQGLAGAVVSTMSAEGGAMAGFMGMTPSALPPPSGPPPLTATTREDGGYELLVFSPGKCFVQVRSAEQQAFPGRQVEIPDLGRYELDLELGQASVSGIVVDKDSGAALPEVVVSLREPGPDGEFKGGATSGADGRFTIAADPGEYVLDASGPPRRRTKMPVSVGSAGAGDVRVEMEDGVEIRGRVVDAAGRPVAEASVTAVDADGGGSTFGEHSLPDGSFRLSGLDARSYTLLAGTERVGYGLRAGVAAGGDPVTLTLRPVARVVVRVVGPDGAPVKDAWPQVSAWDGVRVPYVPGEDTRPTDTPSTFEMSVPQGSLEITARRPPLSGRAAVQTSADAPATAEITLRESPAP
jgi:protocatechuate 3,4-dioxygenase beta subunit